MASPRAAPCVGGPGYPYDSSVRTGFTDTDARIYAWPSRGGVIVLETAEAIDFEFLGLNPLNPLQERLEIKPLKICSASDCFSSARNGGTAKRSTG
jgi:hypothetical protein